MNLINNAISWIEANPIIGAFVLTSLSGTIINIITFINKSIKHDTELNSVFWSKNGYRINAVLLFHPNESSDGYWQEQFSRPDLWKNHITEKSSFFKIRHSIKPKNKEAMIHISLTIKGSPSPHYIEINR